MELLDDSDASTKGIANEVERPSKRRKVQSPSPQESLLSDGIGDDPPVPRTSEPSSKELIARSPGKTSLSKPGSKSGVVYLSRLPPYLKPQTLRQMFSIHGPISNLFLTPESPAAYHNRVRVHNGNKKRQFIEGWIEFENKRHAKACVDAVNGRTTAEGLGVGGMGRRKGGKGRWYKDDVWSVKYLRGFTWEDLMQSSRIEEREREERIRFGIRKERKEHEAFLAGIQGAKVEKTRRRKKRMREGEIARSEEDGGNEKSFQQHKPQTPAEKGDGNQQPESTDRILKQIF